MKMKTRSQRHNKPAMIMAGLVLAAGVSIAHAQEGCDLVASDNSSQSIDTSPGVCVLVKTLNFNLSSISNILVLFDLGHSHGCCHHQSLVFQLDLDGQTIFSHEEPFVPGSPGGCGNTQDFSTFLGNVEAGAHTLEVFLCDEAQSCLLEVYACPPEGPVVDLDIKPGSCPNSFNRNSHGVLPVALVGTDSFDVTQVDLSSIQLVRKDGEGGSVAPHEGPPGPHSEIEDVATPFTGEEQCDCHELEGDGIQDLMMHFKTVDVVAALELNNLPAGDLVSLTLIGNLLDGTPFDADDCIRLVPPGTPAGMMAVGSNLPGAWLDVSPLDLQLDGGGFANFERTFPQTTVVTLTAPAVFHDWVFFGWLTDGGLRPGQSIDLTIQKHPQQIEAIYRPAVLDGLHEH